MVTARLRVVLKMDLSLLSSAMQQFLAADPRLQVEVHSPGDPLVHVELAARRTGRTVEVGVLEDPTRIELQADGRTWVLAYQGLDELADLLVNYRSFDAGTAVRAHRS